LFLQVWTQDPIDKRVEQLLQQMTLEEKVNQLLLPEVSSDGLKSIYGKTGVGSYYIFYLPNSNVTLRNEIQKYFIQNSRLGIPISFAQERLRSGAQGDTIFLMPCAMASTWNADLVKEAHQAIV